MLGCARRTDKWEKFGCVRPVSVSDAVVYCLRLKANHDGVLCNRCWIELHPSPRRVRAAFVLTESHAAAAPSSSTFSAMSEAAADFLFLLQGTPSSSHVSSTTGDVQQIARAVSEPLPVRVECERGERQQFEPEWRQWVWRMSCDSFLVVEGGLERLVIDGGAVKASCTMSSVARR
jgi:hypothetical protein